MKKIRESMVFSSNQYFVADMHELTKPNRSAATLGQKKSFTDYDLRLLYENCSDPLVEAIKLADSRNKPEENIILFSLGDMVVNRVNFGAGTERSIAGKMAKEAREKGFDEIDYILSKINNHKGEFQEYAHRNNLWTNMRFEAIDGISSKRLIFAHLNGNADLLSSIISKEVLQDEKSPLEVFSNSASITHYFDSPGFISVVTNYDDVTLEYSGSNFIMVPYCRDFEASSSAINGLLDSIKTSNQIMDFDARANYLLIHEAIDSGYFEKKNIIKGTDAYNKVIKSIDIRHVFHGDTHAKELVHYTYGDKLTGVTQIAPNDLFQRVQYELLEKIK